MFSADLRAVGRASIPKIRDIGVVELKPLARQWLHGERPIVAARHAALVIGYGIKVVDKLATVFRAYDVLTYVQAVDDEAHLRRVLSAAFAARPAQVI